MSIPTFATSNSPSAMIAANTIALSISCTATKMLNGIDEAFAFARGLGVRDEDWVEILSVSEVRTGQADAGR